MQRVLVDTCALIWLATGDVALQKNVFLHAEYAFASDLDGNEKDFGDSYNFSLNYKF